LPLKEGTV